MGATGTPQARSERDAFATLYENRVVQLQGVEDRLCFGRLDLIDRSRGISDGSGCSTRIKHNCSSTGELLRPATSTRRRPHTPATSCFGDTCKPRAVVTDVFDDVLTGEVLDASTRIHRQP